MAIQFIPIIKALAPVIATAGNMVAEWQKHKRHEQAPQNGSEPAHTPELQELREEHARNAALIAEVAEQLQQLAVQLQAAGETVEMQYRRARRLAYLGMVLAAAALIISLLT